MSEHDYDSLALEYRNPKTKDRRRGQIINICSERYMNKYKNKARGVVARDREDFFQWYYIKVIYALEKWNPEKGTKFTTFLCLCLQGTMQMYLDHDFKKMKRTELKKWDNPVQIVFFNNWDYIESNYVLKSMI